MGQKSEGYLPSLDGLRAVSVGLVVVGHLFAHYPRSAFVDYAISASGLGVLIFFVISGFLITTLLLREEVAAGSISLKRFYLRRIVRLVPVQLSFILFVFSLTFATDLKVGACEYLSAITYTKNYICPGSVTAHLWSLSVEEQFYLIWPPILVLTPPRLRKWVVLGCLAVGPMSRLVQHFRHDPHTFWLTSNIDVLMTGCAAAIWRPKVTANWAVRLSAVAALILPLVLRELLAFGAYTVLLGDLTQAVASAFLILSLTQHRTGGAFRILNLPPVTFVGRASYSIYIWQQLFVFPPALYGFSVALPLTLPWNAVFGVGCGVVSYLALEKPLQALRQRLRRTGPNEEARIIPSADGRLTIGEPS